MPGIVLGANYCMAIKILQIGSIYSLILQIHKNYLSLIGIFKVTCAEVYRVLRIHLQ